MRARLGVALAISLAAAVVVATSTQPAHASRYLRIGIYDEAQTLYGPVPTTFALFKQLHVQEVRLNLYWGGTYGVARTRPRNATNPNDPAYNWFLYDRTVNYAAQAGVHVLFSVYGDGSQTRSLCYVDDLIRGLFALADSGENLPVNLGNPNHEVTMLELAETVIRVAGSPSEIVFEALPIDDPQVRRPDISRARDVLGWEPEIDLEEGLRRWLRALGREPVEA